MLKDLTEDQLRLAELMSDISEQGYHAGWIQGLEFALWEALKKGNRIYGRHVITENEIEELRLLSKKCGCWIIFDNVHEETPLELKLWEEKFEGEKI